VAGPKDEADLRRLLRECPMPGWVSLSLEREPDYFAFRAPGVHDAIIARDRDGTAVGMCSLGRCERYVDGRPALVGSLAELRVSPRAAAASRIVRDGFEACRRLLHDPSRTAIYLTSIVEGNARARRLLESGVPGLPRYRPLDRLNVFALSASAGRRAVPELETRAADAGAIPEVARFLRKEGARFLFAPVWTEAGLAALAGLRPQDFIVARRGGRLVGCMAVWDQRPFRQVVVRGYAGGLGRVRRAVNMLAPLTGLPRLPPAGSALSQAHVSHLAVEDDDPRVLEALVGAAVSAARRREIEVLLLSIADSHPLADHAKRAFRARNFRSMLYVVYWPEDDPLVDSLSGPVHVEAAIL
jgi:hypothetical protein